MIIPHNEIEPETLMALVQSFILREGTDYGNDEVSLKAKTEQILNQIYSGNTVIVYSEAYESCDLVPASQFSKNNFKKL